MGSEAVLLEMKNIVMKFPGVIALHDVHFNLVHGEIHALLGENGAGKSTLIKVLTGINKRNAGTILLEGKEISPKSPLEAQKLGISTVYQEVNLCPHLSVAENIFIGREPMKGLAIDWARMNQDAETLLGKFDLHLDVTQPLDTYSIAVQQMIAIVRAVDIEAKVLILDEPTSSLTSVEVEKLFETMRKLKNAGIGIIFVTHFLDQVYEISDRITVLRNGEYIGTYRVEDLPKVALVSKMVGKEFDELDSVRNQPDGKTAFETTPLLQIKNAFSDSGLKNISLEIHSGNVSGLSGLLGSGRTETAQLIFGIGHLTEGEIDYRGKPMRLHSPIDAIRNGIAYCPENRKTEGIIGDLSIRENIILALQTKNGMKRPISRKEAEKIADEYIRILEIKTPSAEQLTKNLSGGNQQKVILARWLATQPDLLILDEPTRGIDVGTKAEIQKMVMDLADQGIALIYISSELDEMLRCCDTIAVLREKEKVADLAGNEINESVIMDYVAGGRK